MSSVRVLDTNVISEAMRADPDPHVLAFLDGLDDLGHLTAVSVAEIRLGIAVLAKGRRRDRLDAAADLLFRAYGPDRILPFDAPAAEHYAAIVATRNARGRPVSAFDAMIAAICRTRDAELVTRNVRDFDLTGVRVVNPWA